MRTPDDPHWLRRYLERPNRRRLEAVVRAHEKYVYNTALRITRNAQDAQDISQEVFLRLLLEPPPAGSVRNPKAYLAWCVLGRATNLRRAAEMAPCSTWWSCGSHQHKRCFGRFPLHRSTARLPACCAR